LTYPSKAKMIYVQLDKCLKQFREGKNAEAEDGTPDELQRWLAMIADANDEKVRDAAKSDETMRRMQKEMSDMVQDKEVRNMIMQEKYDRMDWVTYGSDQKEEGREEAWEEARKASEEKDRRRVWRMHERGKNITEIAEDMEIGIDTVRKWIDGPKPAFV